jgi:hypothetical protein
LAIGMSCGNLYGVSPTVQYDPGRSRWSFAGRERRWNGSGSIVIKHTDLAGSKATDLLRALRAAKGRGDDPEHVHIDWSRGPEYDPKSTVVENISFVLLDNGRLAADFALGVDTHFDDPDQFASILIQLIAPLLQRQKAQLACVHLDQHSSEAPYWHRVHISMPTRGRTLDHLYEIAESVGRLFEAATNGDVNRENSLDLILGGRADLLVGQPEGAWLDVKKQHYELGDDRGRISLAEAVARFANAEEGGIVVFGMDTKKRPGGGEVIRSLKPVPVDKATARRYRQTIETRLFPFPAGLNIHVVKTGASEGLVVISLPPQEEELKPFLVHGAIVNGRVEGAYISIVRRSGEDSIPITAHQIHSTLAAGRALLRRGQLPPAQENEPPASRPTIGK